MKQFIILLKKDLMELFRTKEFLILASIFIFFALMSPLMAKMTPEVLKMLGDDIIIQIPEISIIDSYIQFFKNLSQIVIFTLIIIFSSLIVNDRVKGLYTNLINNGVNKRNYIFSKITSQLLIVTLIYIISILFFGFYNLVLFDEMFMNYSIYSFISFYIYIIFIISIINMFSTISKSNTISITLSFITMFLIMIFDLFKFGKYLPNYLISISNNILVDKTYFDYMFTNWIITLGLSLIIILLTIMHCNHKEIN